MSGIELQTVHLIEYNELDRIVQVSCLMCLLYINILVTKLLTFLVIYNSKR